MHSVLLAKGSAVMQRHAGETASKDSAGVRFSWVWCITRLAALMDQTQLRSMAKSHALYQPNLEEDELTELRGATASAVPMHAKAYLYIRPTASV